MEQKPKSFLTKFLDTVQPFAIGGASGCFATACIQPLDMIKVRIQLEGEAGGEVNPLKVARNIYQAGGISSFYKGIDSAFTRQIFYGTTRLGTYKALYLNYKAKNEGKEPTMLIKSGFALTAGFIGAMIGNPADLALIRMQSDLILPVEERRNYKNVFDAFRTIVKDEGVLALWRGCGPTVVRALIINLAMLAPYDEAKFRLDQALGKKDSNKYFAAVFAGFLSAFASLPFDNAKTKMQKMRADANGVYPYKSIQDAVLKTVTKDGVTGLWVGFPTYFVRIAPHVIITLIVQDFLTGTVNRMRSKNN